MFSTCSELEIKFRENPIKELAIEHQLKIESLGNNNITVFYGNTVIIGSLNAIISKPNEERPFEGTLSLFVSSLLSKDFFNNDLFHISRASSFLEKLLRSSKFLDLESLLISPAASCWSLRLDLHVIQDDGNLLAGLSSAALILLLNLKLPHVHLDDIGFPIIESFSSKNPMPLNMFFKPLAMEMQTSIELSESLYIAFSSSNELLGLSQEGVLHAMPSQDLASHIEKAQKHLILLHDSISRILRKR